MKKILFLHICFSFVSILLGEELRTFSKFDKHDTIGFIGDSITQGEAMKNGQAWKGKITCDSSIELSGLYHQYIQLFLSTRFPGKDLWTVNLGHKEGTASDGLRRLDHDILKSHLDKAFVLFGMNDINYTLYSAPKSTPSVKKKQSMQNDYVQNMKTLVKALNKDGIQVSLLSPTLYDETVKSNIKGTEGAALELANYVELSKSLAKRHNLPFVNFFEPMHALTVDQQRQNKHWSLTKDRVHPAEDKGGSQFLAYHILRQLDLTGIVYDLNLSWSGKVLTSQNAELIDLSSIGDSLFFSTIETSLPFPILKTDVGFKKYVPFQQELNRQTLMVSEVPIGQYKLFIDGNFVGEFTDRQLKNGINLSSNEKTPQYRLAHDIRDLILFKKALLEQQLRQIKNNARFVSRDIKERTRLTPSSSFAKFKKIINKRGQTNKAWPSDLFPAVESSLSGADAIVKKLKCIRKRLAKLPKVRMHSYRLERVTN